MAKYVNLSREGSDRATGYNMSAKIVRREDGLFVAWLDAPSRKGDMAKIRLAVCDPANGKPKKTLTLGEGIDNHCGPALVEDGNGRLHAIVGHHHGPFLYRWSDDPSDEASWSKAEPLGPLDTYPSLAVDADGTLHLAHRERGDRWQLWYRRKRMDGPWEEPIAIAESPTPGYNHFMQCLTVGPTGTVHLTFQFHYAESGKAADCRGRAAVYVYSEDAGSTWRDQEGERIERLPVRVATMRAICDYPDAPDRHSVRVANHVVDEEDRLWMFCSLADAPQGVFFSRAGSGWRRQDMGDALDGLNVAGGRSTSLTRTADGRLHLLVATGPTSDPTSWFDPSHEIFYVAMDRNGAPAERRQMTETDPAVSHWLPCAESWNWARRETACVDTPWFSFTRGLNSGGIGGDNKSATKTEVWLGHLPPARGPRGGAGEQGAGGEKR